MGGVGVGVGGGCVVETLEARGWRGRAARRRLCMPHAAAPPHACHRPWPGASPAAACAHARPSLRAHPCTRAGKRSLMCMAEALVTRADLCNPQEVANSGEGGAANQQGRKTMMRLVEAAASSGVCACGKGCVVPGAAAGEARGAAAGSERSPEALGGPGWVAAATPACPPTTTTTTTPPSHTPLPPTTPLPPPPPTHTRSLGLRQAGTLRRRPDEHDGGGGDAAHRRVQVWVGVW